MRRKNWGAACCIGVAAITLYSVTGSAGQETPKGRAGTAELQDPERVVQEQVEAYNRRDLDAFLATYSPEIKLHNFPDELTSSGLESMRERYGSMFERAPDLHVKIASRSLGGSPRATM